MRCGRFEEPSFEFCGALFYVRLNGHGVLLQAFVALPLLLSEQAVPLLHRVLCVQVKPVLKVLGQPLRRLLLHLCCRALDLVFRPANKSVGANVSMA